MMRECGLRATLLCGAVALGLAGCTGSDGDRGPPGPPGPSADQFVDVRKETPESLSVEINSVTTNSPPVVNFTVKDGDGRPAIGLAAGRSGNVRFTLSKLVPGTNGDADTWLNYVSRSATSEDETNTVTQATYDREGPLVDHGDGTYTYTFLTDPSTATDPVTGALIGYDPSLTHRLGMQASNGVPAVNATYDFVPSGSAIVTERNIAMTSSCNECHGKLVVHGSRYEVKYCVTCHNPGTSDPENNASGDMAVMVHKIHASGVLAEHYVFAGNDYSEVTYPQDIRNCRKCHTADDEATPQGDNWKTRPTAKACSSCHDAISFVSPPPPGKVLHSGGARPDNSLCGACHTVDEIERYHLTENATPNNPNVPFGLSIMTYEILKVAVNGSNQPVVDFRILRDGTALDILNLPADLTASARYPAFLVSYALPQDGIEEPADYNNLGKSAAQPASVDLGELIAGTAGSVTAGADGAFTATIDETFPDGATLRSVALQGYFQQRLGEEDIGRHTLAVVKAVEGDDERREVVDKDKCLACHEILEGHGGNRVNNVAVCVTCHNPNLSSSGRTVETPNDTIIGQLGADPLTYPEATNNFKDMIHGIHASAVRTTDYEFVRNRNDGIYYNWSEVTFPGDARKCLTCHKPGTFGVPVPESTLASTNRTTTGDPGEDLAAILEARDSVPNETDLVITPASAACFSCHDSAGAATHMELNGGAVKKPRADVAALQMVESCSVCHGAGRTADVISVHGTE